MAHKDACKDQMSSLRSLDEFNGFLDDAISFSKHLETSEALVLHLASTIDILLIIKHLREVPLLAASPDGTATLPLDAL